MIPRFFFFFFLPVAWVGCVTLTLGGTGARANLEDETNAKEFERGYKQVAEFLEKYI